MYGAPERSLATSTRTTPSGRPATDTLRNVGGTAPRLRSEYEVRRRREPCLEDHRPGRRRPARARTSTTYDRADRLRELAGAQWGDVTRYVYDLAGNRTEAGVDELHSTTGRNKLVSGTATWEAGTSGRRAGPWLTSERGTAMTYGLSFGRPYQGRHGHVHLATRSTASRGANGVRLQSTAARTADAISDGTFTVDALASRDHPVADKGRHRRAHRRSTDAHCGHDEPLINPERQLSSQSTVYDPFGEGEWSRRDSSPVLGFQSQLLGPRQPARLKEAGARWYESDLDSFTTRRQSRGRGREAVDNEPLHLRWRQPVDEHGPEWSRLLQRLGIRVQGTGGGVHEGVCRSVQPALWSRRQCDRCHHQHGASRPRTNNHTEVDHLNATVFAEAGRAANRLTVAVPYDIPGRPTAMGLGATPDTLAFGYQVVKADQVDSVLNMGLGLCSLARQAAATGTMRIGDTESHMCDAIGETLNGLVTPGASIVDTLKAIFVHNTMMPIGKSPLDKYETKPGTSSSLPCPTVSSKGTTPSAANSKTARA